MENGPALSPVCSKGSPSHRRSNLSDRSDPALADVVASRVRRYWPGGNSRSGQGEARSRGPVARKLGGESERARLIRSSATSATVPDSEDGAWPGCRASFARRALTDLHERRDDVADRERSAARSARTAARRRSRPATPPVLPARRGAARRTSPAATAGSPGCRRRCARCRRLPPGDASAARRIS